MIRYINTKYNNEVETVDQLDSNDFKSYPEFRKELRRLVGEYSLAYANPCYSSQRCTR